MIPVRVPLQPHGAAAPALIVMSCVCAVVGDAAADDADARAVVERAIEAQGGAEEVAKLQTMRIQAEGTLLAIPGQPGIPLVIEDHWERPEHYLTKSELEFGGNRITTLQALTGDGGWISINGMVQDMPAEGVEEMREQKYAEDLGQLDFLDDDSIGVSVAGETEVDGRPAVRLLVQSEDHRDVQLDFDQESGLLVRRVHDVLDPITGRLVTQEVTFGDYRETPDGSLHYYTITARRAGQEFIDADVTDVEFLEDVDDEMFQRPE